MGQHSADDRGARSAPRVSAPPRDTVPETATPLDEAAAWLKAVRFKKRAFGGVDERDVWKKLNELNAIYVRAVEAERTRYNALIEHYHDACTDALRRQRAFYTGEGEDR